MIMSFRGFILVFFQSQWQNYKHISTDFTGQKPVSGLKTANLNVLEKHIGALN